MSQTSVAHDTFVVERRYDASPDRVYAAWADPAAKVEWFGIPGGDHELDFRVGGRELSHGLAPDGFVYTFDARYEDLVADERIVMTYFMLKDGDRTSVSVATVELKGDDGGTRLVYTEQGVWLDGRDVPRAREEGSEALFEALARHLGE